MNVPYRPTRRGTPRDPLSSFRRDPNMEPGRPGRRGGESALGQEGGDLEVIVVDDGSTDETAEVIERRFGKSVKLLRMATRSGVGAARNEGVSQATGDLLSFLDSDDLWLPCKLKAELDVFERFPGADAIVSDSRFIVDGQFIGTSRFAENGVLAATGGRSQWVDDLPWLWTIPRKWSLDLWDHAVPSDRHQARPALVRHGPRFVRGLGARGPAVPGMPRRGLARSVASHRALDRLRCAHRARRSPGSPGLESRKLGCSRDRLTVVERSIRPDRLTADLAGGLADFRTHTSSELARLEAARA